MSSGGNASDDDAKSKWDGTADKLDDFNKMMGRYCRGRLGGKFGMMFWQNTLPVLADIPGGE